MRKQRLINLFLALTLFWPVLPFPRSQDQIQGTGFVARPKLILVLVIDQFRYDYLVRFRPQFVERGFNLLLSGANFVNCRYDYATTATCPGHASLFTGAYPNIHGIIGNDWYDSSRGRKVYCVEDPDTKLVGGTVGPGFSPRNLVGSTIGDELRIATDFQSKVIAIALKDRASVVPGGHTANAAYWYDAPTGDFVTSTYYMQAPPAWAARFNDAHPAQPYCGKPWQALPGTPGAGGKTLKQFNAEANEPCPDGKFLDWLANTPFMNEIELAFAREAIRNEHLGRGPATDLLAVSLSVNDYVGHAFGPYSAEVADTTIRTDRYLADFFNDLDQLVGLDNVWIALAADHGVAPNPKVHQGTPPRGRQSIALGCRESGRAGPLRVSWERPVGSGLRRILHNAEPDHPQEAPGGQSHSRGHSGRRCRDCPWRAGGFCPKPISNRYPAWYPFSPQGRQQLQQPKKRRRFLDLGPLCHSCRGGYRDHPW